MAILSFLSTRNSSQGFSWPHHSRGLFLKCGLSCDSADVQSEPILPGLARAKFSITCPRPLLSSSSAPPCLLLFQVLLQPHPHAAHHPRAPSCYTRHPSPITAQPADLPALMSPGSSSGSVFANSALLPSTLCFPGLIPEPTRSYLSPTFNLLTFLPVLANLLSPPSAFPAESHFSEV